MAIVFSTKDGAMTLPRMLAAMERLCSPSRPWRIYAVDNGSSDATAHILADWSRRLPLSLLTCPVPGKQAALEQAVRQLDEDLVVFTDDDIIASPNWLAAYERAADLTPEADVFGGPIEPEPLEPLDVWFDLSRGHHAELFARLEVEDGPQSGLNFFGGNFMLRGQHLSLLREVPAHLGPAARGSPASRFGMGEDSALMEAAAARGLLGWGVAAAAVRHLVRLQQSHLGPMLQRARHHGRGWAIRHLSERPPTDAARLRLVASGLAAAAEGWVGRLHGPPRRTSGEFDRLWKQHWRVGAGGDIAEWAAPRPPDGAR
jgi:hypothetical protein